MPGYNVSFDPQTQRDLECSPPVVQSAILDWIEQCAGDPARYVRKPSFPHPLRPKLEQRIDVEGRRYYVVALFQYGQDEQTLHITDIAVTEL